MTFWHIAADEVLPPWCVREHLSRQVVSGDIKLPPDGVAILTKEMAQ
jgi:hypothetical protein